MIIKLKKIGLVGCGNIGSRHLQSLVKLPLETEIEIIEPNKEAQEQAKLRLKEFDYNNSNFKFRWISDIKESSSNDVTILATTSANRVELIEELLNKGNSRFIIEKMVCQSDIDYSSILKLITTHNAKGWVNTSRRYFESYRDFQKKVETRQMSITVNAGNMGLGSNAIHFVDLFLWLTRGKGLSLNGDYLDNEILSSRHGIDFREFSGTITGITSNNSTLTINFFNYDKVPVLINIFGEKHFFIINETQQTIYDFYNKKYNNFRIEYQSELSAKMVIDIFNEDESNLPSLQESQISHNELFKIFNLHIKRITGEATTKCPIT